MTIQSFPFLPVDIMERASIITPVTAPITDLVKNGDPCTFLAGAGISMDAPSNLPSAREICRVLLELCTPTDEVDTLLGLKSLRYELIVEELQKYVDKDLKFMEFFDLVVHPNTIHRFLAQAIVHRHHVVTTNFDYLIEISLEGLLSGEKRVSIRPVVTRRDFETCKDVTALLDAGLVPVYKIHGSRKNFITREDTGASLVTTISALGRDRAEGETFAIEPYKKPVIEGIMRDRVLVVMGYSGSDDFDIGPVLKELPYLRRLIWVDHVQGDAMTAVEIKKEPRFRDVDGLSKVEALLAEIRHDVDFDVILVRANTQAFVRQVLFPSLLHVDQDTTRSDQDADMAITPKFREWVQPLYIATKDFTRHYLAAILYNDLRQFKACIKVAEKGLEIAARDGSINERGQCLSVLAVVYNAIGRYDEALKYQEESLRIDVEAGNRDGEATAYNGIGYHHFIKGNFPVAIQYFEKAIALNKKIDDDGARPGLPRYSAKTAHYMNNLAMCFKDAGRHDEALVLLADAMKIAGENGDLESKAKYISNMAQIYQVRGNLDKALASFEEALHIDEQLGNLQGISARLSLIGTVHFSRDEHDKAKEYFDRALRITQELGDRQNKGILLANLAFFYIMKGDLDKATPLLAESITDAEATGNKKFIASRHAKLAEVYKKRKEYQSAIKEYQFAIAMDREVAITERLSMDLNNLGMVHADAGDPHSALSCFQESLALANGLNYQEVISAALVNIRNMYKDIAKVHEDKKEYDKAIKVYSNAMKEQRDRGDVKNEAVFLFHIARAQWYADDNATAKANLEAASRMHESVKNDQGVSDCMYYQGMIEAEEGHHVEAIERFAKSLTIEAKNAKHSDLALMLENISKSISKLDALQGNTAPKEVLEGTIAIAVQMNDTSAALNYLLLLGEFLEKIKAIDAALHAHEAGIAVARRANNPKTLQIMLFRAATIQRDKKDFPVAIALLEEAIQVVTSLGDQKAIAHRTSNLGMVYYKAKDLDKAVVHFTRAKEVFEMQGDEKNATIAASNADAARKAIPK